MSATITPPPQPVAVPVPPASTVANPLGLPLQALQAGLRRFTVDEYHAMIRLGVIPERGGVVLIEGYLVQTMSTNPPHISTLNRLRKRLDRLLPAGWDSRIQGPITLERSEPEPDYVVVRGGDADYTARHPGPADIGLLVEVADTSVEVDRADQQQLYAKAGVPVYWIVNIPERQIEVYTDPQLSADPPAYANRQDFKPGDAVSVTLDGTAVAAVPVAELLP